VLLQLPHPVFAPLLDEGDPGLLCWSCRQRASHTRTGDVPAAGGEGWKWDVRTMYVNLEGEVGTARRVRMAEELSFLEPAAPIERFAALDGAHAPQCIALADGDTAAERMARGTPAATRGTVCCTVSHFRALLALIERFPRDEVLPTPESTPTSEMYRRNARKFQERTHLGLCGARRRRLLRSGRLLAGRALVPARRDLAP
jgi:hypothetical protein